MTVRATQKEVIHGLIVKKCNELGVLHYGTAYDDLADEIVKAIEHEPCPGDHAEGDRVP
jgi:hypothetical protein